MSETTETTTATEAVVEAPTETKAGEQFPLKHVGFGKYRIEGDTADKVYANKDEALEAQAKLREQAELEKDIGDILPPGFTARDRILQYRGTMLEVPMNEPYLPDGSLNPMYDRAWVYAWAAFNGTSIADRQAKGYEIVRYETLKEMVDNGKCPEHYLSLLRRDGDYLHYGDLVLMRIPRIYWRQQQAEKHRKAIEQFQKIQERNNAEADRLGVPVVDPGQGRNEVTIRL